jgi:DNA repair exonuclease SbcCD ATPase subunit
MTTFDTPIAMRIRALADAIFRDRERITQRELVTILSASFDDVTSELRDDLVTAVKAHDDERAKLGGELRDARAELVQTARERDKARDELDELRVLATNAIDELREELEHALDVSRASLAALAGLETTAEGARVADDDAEPPLCNGTGKRRAHLVVGGRVDRSITMVDCPGCSACRARRGEVLRGGG